MEMVRGHLESVGQIRNGVLGDLCLQPVDEGVVQSIDMLSELSPLGGRLGCDHNAPLRKCFSRCARKGTVTSLRMSCHNVYNGQG